MTVWSRVGRLEHWLIVALVLWLVGTFVSACWLAQP
jgi:cytochrome b